MRAAKLIPFFPLLVAGILTLFSLFENSTLYLLWLALGVLTILCCLADWLLLRRLPKLGLSYGPVGPPQFMINMMRVMLLAAALGILVRTHFLWEWMTILGLTILLQVGFLGMVYTGLYLEPFHLTVSRIKVEGAPAFLPDRPLRVVQLSDLHIEYITRREDNILKEVENLKPDIIVMTGDYMNKSFVEDKAALQEGRFYLSQFRAPFGIYAINGNVDTVEVMDALFTGSQNIRVLDNKATVVTLPGGALHIIGATSLKRRNNVLELRPLMVDVPEGGFSMLLFHFPEWVDVACNFGVDLYLAGDTHGGQVHLPLISGLSRWSLRHPYISGKYQVGKTMLYVSRGLGMQGSVWPRMRLNCPPEIVLLELGG